MTDTHWPPRLPVSPVEQDWSNFSDDDVLAALRAQVPDNPNGASAIDVLYQWGAQKAINAALDRLVAAGKAKDCGSGNYLPA